MFKRASGIDENRLRDEFKRTKRGRGMKFKATILALLFATAAGCEKKAEYPPSYAQAVERECRENFSEPTAGPLEGMCSCVVLQVMAFISIDPEFKSQIDLAAMKAGRDANPVAILELVPASQKDAVLAEEARAYQFCRSRRVE